MFGFRKVN